MMEGDLRGLIGGIIYEHTFYHYSMERKKQKGIRYENYLIHALHNFTEHYLDVDIGLLGGSPLPPTP